MSWSEVGEINGPFAGRGAFIGRGASEVFVVGFRGQPFQQYWPAAFRFTAAREWTRVDAPERGRVAGANAGAVITLANGDVACLGGRQGPDYRDDVFAGAVVFDAATSAFRHAAPMPAPRELFSATALDDGSVLVCGGHGADRKTPVASVFRWFPDRDVWVPARDLPEARAKHEAVKLADGSVLVAGGLGARTFRWDPRTDTWSDAGTLDDARTSHAFVVLDDGRAAVIGGWNETSGELASIEVFDPNAAVWRRDGMLPGARQDLAAAVLADGRVLVSGGRVDKPGVSQTFADSFLWEPGGGSPRWMGHMRVARSGHQLFRLASGEALAVGSPIGFGPGSTTAQSTEIFVVG